MERVETAEETPEPSRFSPRRIPPEIRKAAAVIAIAVVMASSFVAAYTIALGQPFPRNMPVGVVGAAADTAPLVAALQSRPSEFDVHEYPTREAGDHRGQPAARHRRHRRHLEAAATAALQRQ